MGIIKDFREFLAVKHNKRFLTNNLFYGTFGHASVYDNGERFCSEIRPEKLVILQKADPIELEKFLKKKYGTYFGELQTWTIPDFAKTKNTEYYKLITMGGEFVPQTTAKILCSDYGNKGQFDVVMNVKHLASVYKNGVGIKLGETITLEDIMELENILNIQASKNVGRSM